MSNLEFSRNQKYALYVLIALCLMGLSSMYLRSGLKARPGGVVIKESAANAASVEAQGSDPLPVGERYKGKVCFHVVGCVKKPGVYTLEYGDRIVDAVNAAGGAKPDADLQAVNLAEKIKDGSQIVIPSLRSTPVTASSGVAAASRPAAAAKSSSTSRDKLRTPGEGMVHINSADEDQLQRLPGVGPSTAQKIIEYRKSAGRFSSPEQLMDVKGIGPKTFEKMRPFVAL